jgi:hypothetical protein
MMGRVVPGENAEDSPSWRDDWCTVPLACRVIGSENGQEVELFILRPGENPEEDYRVLPGWVLPGE